MNYELEKWRGETSQHVKRHWGLFIFAGLLCWVLWGTLQGLYWAWLSPNDPWATIRMINDKLSTVVPGVTAGGLWLLFFDYVANGNLVKGILNGNIACALFALGVLYYPGLMYLRIIL